jgi:FkbM family methyltransferase
LLSAGDCFIDVGANIGLWTLSAASAVGANGHVFSFEPNPSTFAKLEKNVARNKMQQRISLYPCAVSAKPGQAQFSCKADHNISHLSDKQDGETISVKVINLDSLIETIPCHKKIVGIKIDTEGHELKTLEGAARIIQEHNPWLIVEFNTTLLPSKAISDWGVYDYLTAKGYRPWTYDKKNLHPVPSDFAISGYTNICFRK